MYTQISTGIFKIFCIILKNFFLQKIIIFLRHFPIKLPKIGLSLVKILMNLENYDILTTHSQIFLRIYPKNIKYLNPTYSYTYRSSFAKKLPRCSSNRFRSNSTVSYPGVGVPGPAGTADCPLGVRGAHEGHASPPNQTQNQPCSATTTSAAPQSEQFLLSPRKKNNGRSSVGR